MADIVTFPGTEMEVFEKYSDSRRLDHPNFGDVHKTTYAKGVITAFYAANDENPLVIDDKCDVEVAGKNHQEIPIFYHPPKAYIENWKLNAEPGIHSWGITPGQDDFWIAAGSIDKERQTINRGVYSFSVGDEVTVMFKEGVPVAVLGFASGKPRRPLDYVQVEMPAQIIDSDNPENIGDPHCPYILQLSDRNRVTSPSGDSPGTEDPTGESLGPDGFDLKLLKEVKCFPDKVDTQDNSGVTDFSIDYNYYCFYEPKVMGNRVELIGANWDPPAAPVFGPFYGNMFFGWADYAPWLDYLGLWLNICDVTQIDGAPFLGLWPNGLGRPLFWAITASDGHSTGFIKTVMRTFLIEAGPKLYFVRCFYVHTAINSYTNLYLWKDRIVWPWTDPPADGWSGFPVGGSSWTEPMWAATPNPTPTSVGDCNPQPDDTLALQSSYESFYSNMPHQIFSAASSKKILDDIDSIVAASNAGVDVVACSNGDMATALPPEGFVSETGEFTYDLGQGGIIPTVGDVRELIFKTEESVN